mmetsp:Transcript_1333/g.5301  ORF Transcript_1333/g.5301 Transcript_1333/m.5301 type:complete len:212 (+) Transcript_1333:1697-2332(+)
MSTTAGAPAVARVAAVWPARLEASSRRLPASERAHVLPRRSALLRALSGRAARACRTRWRWPSPPGRRCCPTPREGALLPIAGFVQRRLGRRAPSVPRARQCRRRPLAKSTHGTPTWAMTPMRVRAPTLPWLRRAEVRRLPGARVQIPARERWRRCLILSAERRSKWASVGRASRRERSPRLKRIQMAVRPRSRSKPTIRSLTSGVTMTWS